MTGQRRPSIGEIVDDATYMMNEQKATSNLLQSTSWWMEARLFSELASVTSLLNLGFILSPLLTASYIGRRFGPVYLSGFTLANLTGNLCTFALMSGLFSATDTLSPQAFGVGNYPEVGFIAMRGVLASVTMLLPINILLVLFLEDIMVFFGQNPEAATHAQSWYQIFVFSIPFSILYNTVWKFLSAQHVVKPLLCTSITCTFFLLPLALELCIQSMGFLGSAVAYVLFQASQATFLLLYLCLKQPHHPQTWPGLKNWKQAMKMKPMMEFLHLGAGGILSQSEWIFWEALGLIVGQLGIVPLSVHTIPNQTIMAFCMIPFSFGVALAIRMGVSLPISVQRTQWIVLTAAASSVVFFGIVSIVVYTCSGLIIAVFTADFQVKELAHAIWFKVCLFNFNVSIFGILVGIATGLGKQWTLGVINLVWLWVFGIPVIYYTSILQDGGLQSTWTWINVPYFAMNVCLMILFMTTDWYKVQAKIKERQGKEHNSIIDGAEMEPAHPTETSSLIDP
jgi:MATE family multidrug resistance protein